MHAWQELGLLGENLALQFVNTVDDPGKTRAQSGLPDWPTLLDWAAVASVIDPREQIRLRTETDPGRAGEEVAAVHSLREAAWANLQAGAAGRPADQTEWEALAGHLRWAIAGADLHWGETGCAWRAGPASFGPAVVRARLALAVESFLRTPGELARLRECGRCAALFLDHGRGKGRRWCRMETCGNRAKAARHRART